MVEGTGQKEQAVYIYFFLPSRSSWQSTSPGARRYHSPTKENQGNKAAILMQY